MRLDCLEKRLSAGFASYARIVTRWPAPFILIPLLLTCVLLLGMAKRPPVLKDDLSLYTPSNAPALTELKNLAKKFPINDTDPFYFQRRFDSNRAGYILVTGKPEGASLMDPLMLDSILDLWQAIDGMQVGSFAGRSFNYSDLCVKMTTSWPEKRSICIQNPLIQAHNLSPDSIMLLQYPITQLGWYVNHFLGGLKIESNSKLVIEAKALLLPYQLRHNNRFEDSIAEKWELALSELLTSYHSGFIDVSWWTSETLPTETARDRVLLVHLLIPLFAAVTTFTVGCCFVGSWVHSRPWLGLGGVISAALAILSAIGAVLLAGRPFTSVAYCMPFIVFSIGVDNVFILLSAWRKTPALARYSERMALTFRDAGVSITVTSLTDGLSFGVGCLASFPSVRIFCLYAAVAILFVYVYQLTFFAGIMALTGRREVAGRHCFTFQKVHRKVAHETRSAKSNWQNGALPNGLNAKLSMEHHQKNESESNHALARFFRDAYATFLLNPVVRTAIIISFFVYIGFAAWGCTKVQLGLEPIDLLPTDSYGRQTLLKYERYFSESGSYLHVWIDNLTALDYNRRVWVKLRQEMEIYEHTEFTGYSDSWLRVFLAFVRTAGLLLTPDNFVYILKNIFLKTPQYQVYSHDLVFNSDATRLVAARFPVHLRYVGMSNQSRAMNFFRRLADKSDMRVNVYSDFFRFAEQYDAVLPGTLINVGLAGAAVIMVSLLLIPQPLCAIWVSLTIVSINVGILGYMSFWDVHLDFVSMVTIVMSIGFCVDFSAHLAYHFAKERGRSAPERLRMALYAVGTPILQSATSTILGVLFMIVVESYVFRSFVKTVILVILLGAFHGLVVLPVLLTLFFCNKDSGADTDTYQKTTATTGGGSATQDRDSPSNSSNCSHRPAPVGQDSPVLGKLSSKASNLDDFGNASSISKNVSIDYITKPMSFIAGDSAIARTYNNTHFPVLTPDEWTSKYVLGAHRDPFPINYGTMHYNPQNSQPMVFNAEVHQAPYF